MIGGALVSQAVLDDGVSEEFPPGGQLQLEYGDIPPAPLIWMDDVLNSTKGLKEAREANKKMNIVLKKRGLCLNKEKSGFLVIGSRKQKMNITQYLEAQPLMCGEIETKENPHFKWLGQIMSSRGLADSVALTIADKEGKIRGACLEIAIIVNDWRAKVVGGFETAMMLWENAAFLALCMGQAHG